MNDDHAILEPGTTCAVATTAPRSGLLVDGRDYYRAFHDVCLQAQREILVLGWQFDSRVALLRGDDAEGVDHPVGLLKFLANLCEQRPELRIYMLAWESSPVFALEREPFQRLTFRLRSHCNLRFETDDCHPTGASQHQKLVVIDRSLAVLGGMDLCSSRWDDRSHQAEDPRRKKPWPGRGTYHPYHDVQAYVTGDAVDTLRGWFVERWQRGTGETLELCDAPRAELGFTPSVAVDVPRVALARTLPAMEDPPCEEVRELRALHLRAIEAATASIYIENQYFSSEDIRRALVARMRRGGEPLEIVIVLPHGSAGLKEQVSIGVRQAEILRQLKAVALADRPPRRRLLRGGAGPRRRRPGVHPRQGVRRRRSLPPGQLGQHHQPQHGARHRAGPGVGDRGADDRLREARVELLREHCGLELDEARALLGPAAGLVARLDGMARARSHRLRMHAMCEESEPGKTIAHALREDIALDPCEPMFEDVLPEPGHWYQHGKDKLGAAVRRLRQAFATGARSRG